MKSIFIFLIWLYWKIWPDRFKRPCLFRETCSCHVHRILSNEGFFAGIRALIRRFQMCRPSYHVIFTEADISLRLADNSMLAAADVAPTLLRPYQDTAQRIHKHLNRLPNPTEKSSDRVTSVLGPSNSETTLEKVAEFIN